MEKRSALEKELSYEDIEKMFNKNKWSRCIKHLNTYRTDSLELTEIVESEKDLLQDDIETFEKEDKRMINETVEDIRTKLIDAIIDRDEDVKKGKTNKRGELLNPIRNIYGFASVFVHRRIIDIINSDKVAKKHCKRMEDVIGTYGKRQDEYVFTLQQKQILMECLNHLKADEKTIITDHFYYGKTVGELAEKLGEDPRKIAQKKFRALEKMRVALIEKYGEEIKDISGRLHDVSIWQEILDEHPEILQRPLGINPPKDKEEEKMNNEYTEMLLHTVYDMAKLIPVSDMMDEYIYGRLKGEQKELFEEHLLECDECYEKLRERRTVISALPPTLEDEEKSKESKKKREEDKKNKYQ
jgi:RNA polymerase sigma factor (sigma-70 family)